MHFFYNLGIIGYGIFLRIAALFNPKAKKWVIGRTNWRKNVTDNYVSSSTCIWFHCASLGEFEQGRPLIEKIKKLNPNQKIVLTFFSPSGYEIRKNYELVDLVSYLPLDTPKNARDFIRLINPSQAYFIKYEFWANYLFELQTKEIPVYCVSGLFRKEQRFFKKNNHFFKQVLHTFSHFFVQNESSAKLLSDIGLTNVTISGDTRYDRVIENATRTQPHPILERFKSTEIVCVIGSSWSIDESLIMPLINNGLLNNRIVIAPHETNSAHITQLEKLLTTKSIKLSECTITTNFDDIRVLIIDSIGLLANAYQYGDYAYVGGAFGKGLHNILEPAVFGLPVIFGPHHQKFPEAQQFIDAGIGFSITSSELFLAKRAYILDHLEELTKKTKSFIHSQSGASTIILNHISNS